MVDNINRPDSNQNAINALNQITNAIANLNKTVNNVFPQIVGIIQSGVVQSGSFSPTNFVGYASVTDPATGHTLKFPYYL